MWNSYRDKPKPDWYYLIDTYGQNVLYYLGLSEYQLKSEIETTKENPVIRKLIDHPDVFLQAARKAGDGKENLAGLSRLVIIVQTMLYDKTNGPEGDGKLKALRRHWYVYFKRFAQVLAKAIDPDVDFDDKSFNTSWSGRQSQVTGWIVDNLDVTYKELWLEDGSRMMEVFGPENALYPGFWGVLAVEKDSLHPDFIHVARAAGMVAAISGKGKNSKAAVELMLRRVGWKSKYDYEGPEDPFGDRDIRVFHLSDHDYDGEQVIGHTFGTQMTRYHPYIQEGRIGIKVDQAEQFLEEAGKTFIEETYAVKSSNTAYKTWAKDNAVFISHCATCGTEGWVNGFDVDWTMKYSDPTDTYSCDVSCPTCYDRAVYISKQSAEEPRGFEVEALTTLNYYESIAATVLETVNWDDVVVGLRNQARPGVYEVQSRFVRKYINEVAKYQVIQKAIDKLRDAQYKLEEELSDLVYPLIDGAIEDSEDEWWANGEDPEVDDYKRHIVKAGRNNYGSVFRPFDLYEREQIVVRELEEDEDLVNDATGLDIEDWNGLVQTVTDILYEEDEEE